MKTLNIDAFRVIRAGICFKTTAPVQLCELLQVMERNDAFIYWLQPPGGGVQDQVPAVNVNGAYYLLNQKLEKAVFRHIRLTRNFVNSETLEDGTLKLRIPMRLFREKQRSSHRFSVRRSARCPRAYWRALC